MTTNLHFDGIIHLWVGGQRVYCQVELLGHVCQSADHRHTEEVSEVLHFNKTEEREDKLPQPHVGSCVRLIRFLYLVKLKVKAGILRQFAGPRQLFDLHTVRYIREVLHDSFTSDKNSW